MVESRKETWKLNSLWRIFMIVLKPEFRTLSNITQDRKEEGKISDVSFLQTKASHSLFLMPLVLTGRGRHTYLLFLTEYALPKFSLLWGSLKWSISYLRMLEAHMSWHGDLEESGEIRKGLVCRVFIRWPHWQSVCGSISHDELDTQEVILN